MRWSLGVFAAVLLLPSLLLQGLLAPAAMADGSGSARGIVMTDLLGCPGRCVHEGVTLTGTFTDGAATYTGQATGDYDLACFASGCFGQMTLAAPNPGDLQGPCSVTIGGRSGGVAGSVLAAVDALLNLLFGVDLTSSPAVVDDFTTYACSLSVKGDSAVSFNIDVTTIDENLWNYLPGNLERFGLFRTDALAGLA